MNTNEQKFDCLSVTHVEVSVFKQGAYLGKLRGFATIVLNGQLQIRGLRIMDSENGLYVGYPTNPYCREDFQHMVLPMTRQLREHIECVVLEKYQQAIG